MNITLQDFDDIRFGNINMSVYFNYKSALKLCLQYQIPFQFKLLCFLFFVFYSYRLNTIDESCLKKSN